MAMGVYKVFSRSFEGFIKFKSVIDGASYSAWGSACLSEASFRPRNMELQISCLEFIKPSRREKTL
jgi:hypothetical protein